MTKKDFFDLGFDQATFFLHHDDLLQALGEASHGFRCNRIGQAELEDAQAELLRHGLVDAQIVEGLHEIEIGLAGGDDAELGLGGGGGSAGPAGWRARTL